MVVWNGAMNRLAYFLTVFAAFSFVSCGDIQSLTPVVDQTEASLQRELEGVWKMGEGVFHLGFDESGSGHLAWLEWEEEEFVKREGTFDAMRSADDDDIGYLSLRLEEEPDESESSYLFGGFKLVEPDTILLWEAGPQERYESLLEEDSLVGEIRGSGYTKVVHFLDGPGLAESIGEVGEFFDLEDPVVMTRIIRPESDEP